MTSGDQPYSTGLTCECCGETDGVINELGVEGVAVDSMTMLCLYCQPCPDCNTQGGTCWDDPQIGCTNTARRTP